ncbi:TPA: DUF2326 domain-containing protein [Streptococcus suis]|uniref:DUF2326 domain-containing protein n=1 Tax=Streptococcus suis TaxID=1307 RepID=UPI001ABE5808|nr:DUF2326 domain-containing protein [Streptococcus suis]MBO4110795.1 DUF2326 domain-containing protein [Streptococcus suis]HEM3643018.1 DUF2326 domain-containing protein [Streptococcus suis]HEM3668423.1 DUF2326 domain-containing protein [Streptococcus suis]HEM3722574.1 DUF2326 domain-containing protein [Streptococcus suis]
MLIEMWSPVFKKNGQTRKPVRFHPGLNVIMGMDLADNSIGKSSSLLAIDFIFGGNSYLKSIAVKKLGDHPIYFCFQFEKKFYFARDTAKPDIITYCNDDYSPTGETMPLENFLNKLKKRYHLDSPELSFRLAMSGFFRIAGKNNQNTDFPLQVYSIQKSSESITTLIQLFNLYDNIARYKERLKDKSDQLTTFRNARKYAFISNLVGGKKQFEANVSEIKRLEYDLSHLQDTHQDKIDSDDIEKNQQKIQLRNTKLELENSLRDKQRRLKLLDISIEFGLYPTESDLTELQRYFPDTNLKKLYEVEAYHKKLATILDSEFSTERETLSLEIEGLESQLTVLNRELQELGSIPNLSTEFLENYSKLTAIINALKEQNGSYLKESALSKEKSEADSDLKRSTEDILIELEGKINAKMREFNNVLYPDICKAPQINLKAHNSYSFYTPDDDGTGTKFKGMILFDLTMLYLTNLPALAHDLLLLSNISYQATEALLKLYDQSKSLNKQVFLAFDKASSYSPEANKLLSENTVLRLSSNGNELYGISWNKGENSDEI